MSNFVYREGQRVAVLRPSSPDEVKRSLEEAQRILREEKAGTLSAADGKKQFNEILSNRQFIFMGFLGVHAGEILGDDGQVFAHLEPGDSFVPESELAKMTVPESQ